MKHTVAALLFAGILVAVLYLIPIPERGLVGPDEPRYASIARQMAESGDWITPVLWNEPWFEKPALLFWIGAIAYNADIENYTRLPVALLSLGFLVFFYWVVFCEFGTQTAVLATCILSTSAGWVAYSDAGVFDAPLVVFTSSALFCLLPYVRNPDVKLTGARPYCFGVLLGLAVLSKGLVAPIVVFFALLPVLGEQSRRIFSLFHYKTLLPFLFVCTPWYIACYLHNGTPFINEFILRHHVYRFFSSSLQHEQPLLFYIPVLLVFLLPWVPLLVNLQPRAILRDSRERLFGSWIVGTIVFFSLSVNKLPAYILPVLPPLAILLAVHYNRHPRRIVVFASALMLLLVPLAGMLLPEAMASGFSRAWADLDFRSITVGNGWGLTLVAACALAILRLHGPWPLVVVSMAAAILITQLKLNTYPVLSRTAGVREFYLENQEQANEGCIEDTRRHTLYGLRHYSRDRIPECTRLLQPLRIRGNPPQIYLVPLDSER